jgi:hypothetical protein
MERKGGTMRRFACALILAAYAASTFACGSFAPPQSCGEGIGGTADQAVFNKYFSDMFLVVEATGEVPPAGEDSSAAIPPDDSLAVKMQVLNATQVRACVQERTGGGGIPADKTASVEPGEALLPLGKFSAGNYVVRVIVDGNLVKNLTFEVR